MATTALQPIINTLEQQGASRLPAVPWRDPHLVSPEELASYIVVLEKACVDNPANADLRTCLGIAHAMNWDAYKSMDNLELARELDPESFWAQAKYAELHYRLRVLDKAEVETIRALDLATNGMELSVARKQLAAIRELKNAGTMRVTWKRSLVGPGILMAVMSAVLLVVGYVSR